MVQCPVCGVAFTARIGGKPQLYCGAICRRKARTSKAQADAFFECGNCGKTTARSSADGGHRKAAKFCSNECTRQAYAGWRISCELKWGKCRQCGTEWITGRVKAKTYCSAECAKRHQGIQAAVAWKRKAIGVVATMCSECGQMFTGTRRGRNHGQSTYCGSQCRRRAGRQQAASSGLRQAHRKLRRARKRAGNVEVVNPQTVFARDLYICHLCGRVARGKYPALDSPSLDHVVPLSRGGDHSMANVRTAHWACNVARSNVGSAQPRLMA